MAEEDPPPATVDGPKTDPLSREALIKTAGRDFASPITTDARYIFISSAAATLFLALNGHDYNTRVRTKTRYEQPLKKFGYVGEVIGWGYLNAIYGLGYLIHGASSGDQLSMERAEIMGSASLYTLGTTSILKATINSHRPGHPDRLDSFPSGHASMSFAFATVVAAEHPWYWGIPAYAVASFISYSRLNDDWHWLEDVVAGAGLGASYGLGVWLNRRKLGVPFILSALPAPDLKGLSLSFSTSF